jgi:protein-S-isoprenylcysteine O-methyltransferase Ste14
MLVTFRVFLAGLLITYPAIQVYFGRRGASGAPRAGYSPPDSETLEREGKGLLVIQAAAFFGIVGCVVIEAIYPRLLQTFDLSIPISVRWVAAGIAALSLYGLILVHRELGRFWSAYLELKSDHQLIESGLYRWVRHPMYAMLIIHSVGLGFVAANGLLLALGVLRSTLFLIRIPREELMLTTRFGDQYRKYAKSKGLLFPRLRSLR